ncbi:MAG TPA: hypothetical protein GX506_12170 [Firmicutes bacterium]|nr:hypothetical protein [Bacillota bacterium]
MSEEAEDILSINSDSPDTSVAVESGSDSSEMSPAPGEITSLSVEEEMTVQRRRRHRFTPYEDQAILKAREVRRGLRKQEFKRIAEALDMPQASIERRFYFLLRQKRTRKGRRQESTTVQELNVVQLQDQASGFFKQSDDSLKDLLSLPSRVEAIEKRLNGMLDLKGFVEHLIEIDRHFDREQELLTELAQKDREVQRMKGEIAAKIEKLNKREEELNEIYQLLEVTLQQFMNLSSIDKLRVLGDFTLKIETVIDRFGNVIRRRPVVVP